MSRKQKFDARLSSVPVTEKMFTDIDLMIERLGISRSEFIRVAVEHFINKSDHDISEAGYTITLGTTSCTQEMKDGVDEFAQEFKIKPVAVIRLAIEEMIGLSNRPAVLETLFDGKEDSK